MTATVDDLPDLHDLDVLESARQRCVAALAAAAFRDGDRAGWVSWELGPSAAGAARGGDPTLYSGDAGAGWACTQLGAALGDAGLRELGRAALRHAARRAPADGSLLAGSAGIALARGIAPAPPEPHALPAADLTAGLAGVLLAQVRGGAPTDDLIRTVRALQARAEPAEVGCCWTDPVPPDERPGPLCGLAHGASGVALALAEAAARTGDAGAAATATQALQWERLWFDPVRGWPDLRDGPVAAGRPSGRHPARWCHGAAGIGLVRLRLLALVDGGLELGVPPVVLRAEAEAAVGLCLDELDSTASAAAEHGPDTIMGGLTLCHGAGGPLELLVSAAHAFRDDALLARARMLAAGLVTALDTAGDDPSGWPSGDAHPGAAGLLLGLSGVALTLARLVDPALPSAALLPGA